MAAGKPTIAEFGRHKREFPTSKDAYLWLLCRFIEAKPALFGADSWDLLIIDTSRSERKYFARSPQELFTATPRLADNKANYAQLPNGWYANANLDNRLKERIVSRFAEAGQFRRGDDWNWRVLE